MTIGFDYDVRGLRQRLGVSQTKLAQRLGVTPSTVARWEQGVMKPRPEIIERLQRLDRRLPKS